MNAFDRIGSLEGEAELNIYLAIFNKKKTVFE